ncbi:hypothetical protein K7H91_09735 [Martelella mediterranea]|nr:hypothetical protein [Martelella mediterranea]MCD1634054.1 hypothetical protein [Martelella mediterranea]
MTLYFSEQGGLKRATISIINQLIKSVLTPPFASLPALFQATKNPAARPG